MARAPGGRAGLGRTGPSGRVGCRPGSAADRHPAPDGVRPQRDSGAGPPAGMAEPAAAGAGGRHRPALDRARGQRRGGDPADPHARGPVGGDGPSLRPHRCGDASTDRPPTGARAAPRAAGAAGGSRSPASGRLPCRGISPLSPTALRGRRLQGLGAGCGCTRLSRDLRPVLAYRAATA